MNKIKPIKAFVGKMVVYNDDEQIPRGYDNSDGDTSIYEDGDIELISHRTNQVPLKETELKVLLELTGSENVEERFPLDIVAVLDVSGSMDEEDRIGELKAAMEFVIKKLSPTDRLCVVIYSFDARRLEHLSLMTESCKSVVINQVNGLRAHGLTNTYAGLEMGVKILNDRRFKEDRTGAILLMSDGEQSRRYCDARHVPHIDQFPIYTFALGRDSTDEVLDEISRQSHGGTFTSVRNETNLSEAFATCLGGLLTVVVKDLKLTIKPFDDNSRIDDVSAGKYHENQRVNADNSITIPFGDLYSREVRKVLIYAFLFATEEETTTDVVQVSYTYSSPSKGDERGKSDPVTIKVERLKGARGDDVAKVTIEHTRAQAVHFVREAKSFADNHDFRAAIGRLNEAKNLLKGVDLVDDPDMIINGLLDDVEKLLTFTGTPELYHTEGKRTISSFLSSQLCQRGNHDHLLHATPVMLHFGQEAMHHAHSHRHARR